MYENLIEKHKYIRTNGRLENGLMYLYQAFQLNLIDAYTTYTKYIYREIIRHLLHIQFIGNYQHMTTMDGIVNWMKLAHLLLMFFSRP